MESTPLLIVLGASGAGKTAALETLQSRPQWQSRCFFFDSIGVPPPEVMEQLNNSGRGWQFEATKKWLSQLSHAKEAVCILEGQTRPEYVEEIATAEGLSHIHMMLLHCDDGVRSYRLRELRHQPELDHADMANWARYLLNEAELRCLPIVDTSDLDIEGVALRIKQEAQSLIMS